MARPATAAVRLLTGEREPCRLGTTGPIDVDTGGLLVIDGVQTEVGDRILVKDQSDGSENGIRTASTGQWYRASDAATARTIQYGTTVFVQQGTVNANKIFKFNTFDPAIGDDPISIINVTPIKSEDSDASGFAFVVDEDDMVSNSASKVPTQQSVKAYADTKIAASLLTARGDIIFRNATVPARLAASTAGYLLMTNGAGADPSWAGFVQAGTGAVTRTWQGKARDVISVKDFGAVGDNSTDDTAAIVAALAAAISLGACVYAPAGTYRVSSAITLASGAYIYGDGPTLTTFRTASATANVFTVNGIGSGLCNLRIDSSVTRSAGWFVDIAGTAANFRMINFTMATPFEAIRIADASADILFANGRIDDTVAATGRSVRVGTGTGTGCVLVVFSNVNFIAPTGAKPLSHIALFNCGDLSLIGCSLLYGGYNLEIAPGASQGVYSVKSTNCYFDQAGTTNIRIVPTSTGIVRRGVFVNNWISAAGTHNIDIEPASTATVDGLTFSCNEVFGGTYGYYMTGISTNLRNITVANDMIAGSSSIGIAMDTVGKVQITNNIIGDVSGYAAVPTGVSLFGTMTDLRVANNNLVGSTSKIAAGGATFAGASRIEANIGYNPVGLTAAATMGASPFTYTAGPSPETHYVRQSATNTATIAKGGQQVATLAGASTYYVIELAPNQSYVTTWTTTAPTYTKDVH